jgi:hypothetical protein
MKKKVLIVSAVVVVAISLIAVLPAGASVNEGCTPGYWKQEHHFDSWMVYSPSDDFNAVFGVGPPISLLDALSAKRKDFDSGVQAALVRHAVAALLNAASGDVDYWFTPDQIIEWASAHYVHPDKEVMEEGKDLFAEWNETGCPLN